MSSIIYTAHNRATLVSGHSAGTSYSFDIPLRSYDFMRKMPKKQHVSLNGKTESVLRGLTSSIGTTLGPYIDSLHDDVVEFLESVAGGESFTFDSFGTVAVPDNPVSVVLSNNSVPEVRITHGVTPYRTASLNLRIIS